MTPRPHRIALVLAAFVLAALACAMPVEAPPAGISDEAAPRITLPPAWTATASATERPPTATVTPTLSAAALAARQTAALWPPLGAVEFHASSVDQSDWAEVDLESASFRLPPSYQIVDMGGFDDAMVLLMEAMAQGMVGMFESFVTPVPGAPTPTPLSLEAGGFDIDLLMAIDEAGLSAVFLTGGPVDPGVDLETALTEAIGWVEGEVTVLQRETLIGAPLLTARAIVRSRDSESGESSDQVGYVILSEGRTWNIWYAAEPLEPMLPVFEASALSLRPKASGQ
ncbi:MAG: hypothetical protein A2Z17_06600 [Gammaproteobacteria bacterium RBG_16_66_13]|nr:MAG: hypothetical protein A2Z17_06600 [Gammaproteobacteria bacterium RBG_16_66_13]